jgi:type VI secretion system protein ImpH
VLGTRVWDQQSKIIIVVGPIGFERYLDFLPTGSALDSLRGMARLYLGSEMEFDVQLVLRSREVPVAALQRREPIRLGWTSWLTTTRPRTQNPHIALTGEAS